MIIQIPIMGASRVQEQVFVLVPNRPSAFRGRHALALGWDCRRRPVVMSSEQGCDLSKPPGAGMPGTWSQWSCGIREVFCPRALGRGHC